MKQPRIIKIIAYSLICVMLIGVALYYIPWPTWIDMEMTCSEVTQNGDVLSDGTVTIQGWQMNYLFKDDQIIIDAIKLPGCSAPMKTLSDTHLTLSKEVDPHAAFGILWDGTNNRSIYISLEENWASCLIRLDGERYFACSLDNASEIAEILEIHKWILH